MNQEREAARRQTTSNARLAAGLPSKPRASAGPQAPQARDQTLRREINSHVAGTLVNAAEAGMEAATRGAEEGSKLVRRLVTTHVKGPGVIFDAVNYARAKDPDRAALEIAAQRTGGVVGGNVGAALFGAGGALRGGTSAAAAGPVGAAVGGTAGGVAGAVRGRAIGSVVGSELAGDAAMLWYDHGRPIMAQAGDLGKRLYNQAARGFGDALTSGLGEGTDAVMRRAFFGPPGSR